MEMVTTMPTRVRPNTPASVATAWSMWKDVILHYKPNQTKRHNSLTNNETCWRYCWGRCFRRCCYIIWCWQLKTTWHCVCTMNNVQMRYHMWQGVENHTIWATKDSMWCASGCIRDSIICRVVHTVQQHRCFWMTLIHSKRRSIGQGFMSVCQKEVRINSGVTCEYKHMWSQHAYYYLCHLNTLHQRPARDFILFRQFSHIQALMSRRQWSCWPV